MSQRLDFMGAWVTFNLSQFVWEVGAWQFPYKNISCLRLIFLVEDKGLRETIPDYFPKRYANLVTLGWSQAPAKRPTATEVITELAEIEKEMKVSMQMN